MSGGDEWDAWAVPVCVCLMLALVLILWCLDRRDGRRARREHGGRDPAHPRPHRTSGHPRLAAAPCKLCGALVSYENHPAGQKDAMRLHQAYECTAAPAQGTSR